MTTDLHTAPLARAACARRWPGSLQAPDCVWRLRPAAAPQARANWLSASRAAKPWLRKPWWTAI